MLHIALFFTEDLRSLQRIQNLLRRQMVRDLNGLLVSSKKLWGRVASTGWREQDSFPWLPG